VTAGVPVFSFATTFIVEAVHRRLVPHRQPLAVSVDGQLDRRVTELALHVRRRLALLEQQARECVAETVRREVERQLCRLQRLPQYLRTRLSSGSVPASVQNTHSGNFDQPRFSASVLR
jgi:hypothetical protein